MDSLINDVLTDEGLFAFCCTFLSVALCWIAIACSFSAPSSSGMPGVPGYKKVDKPPRSIEQLRQPENRKMDLPLLSMEEVGKHCGGNGLAEWVALRGVIWDVSSNAVYREGGGYHVFTGKDATFALGTMQFEDVGKSGWDRKLNKEQLECLDEWCDFYAQRYKRVGYLREVYELKSKNE